MGIVLALLLFSLYIEASADIESKRLFAGDVIVSAEYTVVLQKDIYRL